MRSVFLCFEGPAGWCPGKACLNSWLTFALSRSLRNEMLVYRGVMQQALHAAPCSHSLILCMLGGGENQKRERVRTRCLWLRWLSR